MTPFWSAVFAIRGKPYALLQVGSEEAKPHVELHDMHVASQIRLFHSRQPVRPFARIAMPSALA